MEESSKEEGEVLEENPRKKGKNPYQEKWEEETKWENNQGSHPMIENLMDIISRNAGQNKP